MSCLDVQVSFYKNCYDARSSDTIDLLGFLDNEIYKEEVNKIRSISNPGIVKRSKLQLPCVTVSGVFSKRSSLGLLRHSGLLGIDIDASDNRHIADFNTLQYELIKIKNVAYCGRSIFNGYFLIVPIVYPENHLKHFLALQKLFKQRYSIVIDPHCANVDRLRTISYDENRYFNHEAVPFSSVIPDIAISAVTNRSRHVSDSSSSIRKLQDAVKLIEELGLDITGNEYDWWRIGCAIVSVLDEEGRGIFHSVSRYYKNEKHNYTPDETNKKYDQCINSKSECTIATFFWYFNKAMRESTL